MKNLFLVLSFSLFLVSCKEDQPDIVPNYSADGSTAVVLDEFEGVPLVVIGNARNQFMVAFERTLSDGTILEFTVEQRILPIVMSDSEGNKWDIEGKAVEGPRKGERLTPLNAYIGFWFAWGTMFPGIELFNGASFDDSFVQETIPPGWTIPTDKVFTVLGQDAIPAIDEPKFEEFDQKSALSLDDSFLKDDELVVGVTIDGSTKLYPHSILNWHEIVNDQIGDFYFSLSFCPITGTAIMWEREINGQVTTFGVSGLLYNGNVIPYDRNSESLWSQMKQECINGNLLGTQMTGITQVLETTWGTWKVIKDNPVVLTAETGFSKDYSVNPYENYVTDHSHLSYPVEYDDDRLQRKERVLGVIVNGKAKAYRFQDFE